MGFLLWAALTAWALAAGLALALRAGRELSIAEQLVGAGVAATALVLAAIQLLGYLSLLYPSALAGLVLAGGGALLAWARPPLDAWAGLGRRLAGAARAAVWGPGAALATLLGAALTLYLAAYAWLLPSWGWDAMWYHDPLTAYAYQEHSLGWVETHIPFINSYPKNVELLALWNGIFAPDDRLIDGAQLPLALLGVLALAGLGRRAGASPALAWGLGLCWLLMPAVLLNIPSNYVDVAAASLWLAAVLFLARLEAGGAHRLFGALALGCYAGAKVTGVLHTGMIAPVVLLAVLLEARRDGRWARALGQLAAMALAIVALGGATYLRNVVRYGNPVWPAKYKLPLLGTVLPGTWEMTSFNTPPGGGVDDMAALWRSFTKADPFYFVDVREGGFGRLWLYGLLPCCVVALAWGLVELARRRPRPGLLAVAVLLLTALATPARWWPRYTLGFPAAGLLAAAALLALLPRRWLQQVALAGVAALSAWQAWPANSGWRAPPEKLLEAWRLSPVERAHLKFDNWQQPGISLRDQVVEPGEASIYDESVSFVYQLWRYDWRNRVLFRPLKGDPGAWLASLESDHVRWAAIGRGSPAERTLHQAGWIPLWACGSENCGVWVRPGTDLHGWHR